MSVEIWARHIPWVTLGDGDPDSVLKQGWDLLDGYHVWLSAGTALGLYRDGRHIPHDTDIDLGILCQWGDGITDLLPWSLLRRMTYEGHTMQLAYVKDRIIFDVYFFYEEGDLAINYNDAGVMHKPLSFVKNLEPLEHNGATYQVPSPIEDYLAYRYRDWKTPTEGKRPWYEDAAPGLLGS